MKLRAILVALCLTLALGGLANAKAPKKARLHRCQVHWFADCEASYGSDSGSTQCPVIFGESTTRRRSCNADLDSNQVYSQKPIPQRNSIPQLIDGQWTGAQVRVRTCPAGTFTFCSDALCNIPNPDDGFVLATCACQVEEAQWGFTTSARKCEGKPVGIPMLKN